MHALIRIEEQKHIHINERRRVLRWSYSYTTYRKSSHEEPVSKAYGIEDTKGTKGTGGYTQVYKAGVADFSPPKLSALRAVTNRPTGMLFFVRLKETYHNQ